MATTLEHLAIDASAGLTNSDRQELFAAYEEPGTREGSIVVALMIVSIIVSVTRLVLDHCVDEETFSKSARNPGLFTRLRVRRKARQVYRQMQIDAKHVGGVTPEQIADEILSRGLHMPDTTLSAVWTEGRAQ